MADRIALDVSTIEREVSAMLAAFPEMADDEALRADMVEGSTDLESVLSRVIDHRQEAKEVVAAIKARMGDIADRRARYERRVEAMTSLAKRLLTISGRDSIVLPEATVSLSAGRESVEVVDVDALPQGYFVTERKADKTAIGAALKKGDEIPGARLVRSDDSLTVRTK